jgi:hypothetical protein
MGTCKTSNVWRTSKVSKDSNVLVVVCRSKDFHACYNGRRCVFYLCFSHIKCWIILTLDPFSIQRIQGHVWKEECWYFDWISHMIAWLISKKVHNLHLDPFTIATKWTSNTFESLEKWFIWHSKSLPSAPILFIKKNMVPYECLLNIVAWIDLVSKTNIFTFDLGVVGSIKSC